MNKALAFFISLSIGIGLFIWITKIIGWQEIKSSFLIFTGWQGMVIIILSFLILLISSLKWQMILKSQGYKLSQRQLFPPYLTCFSLNYLFQMMVVGGDIFRTYILREKHSVPWKNAASSVIIDKILDSTCFIASILAGFAFFLLKIGLPPRNLAIFFGVFLLVLVSGIGFFYFKSFRKESIARPLAKFFEKMGLPNGEILEVEKETFRFFKAKKLVFWQGLGLSFLRVSLTWLRTWILILFLGKTISALPALSVLGFYYIAMMVPIPADLGAHEAIQVFAFNSLGIGSAIAPAFAMIQRGAQLILAFIGIILFFKLGFGLLQTFLFKRLGNLINNKQ